MPHWVAAILILISTALNTMGWVLRIAESVPLYDEIAHFLTPLILVAITAEIIYRAGGDNEFFPTPARSALTGGLIGLIGAIGWEVFEIVLDDVLGVYVFHPLRDSISDVLLGVAGGAIGAWLTDRYLDRLLPGKTKRARQ